MKHKIAINKIVKLDDDKGMLLYINCKINKKPATMIIDTGASRSCLDICTYKTLVGAKSKRHVQSNIETIGLGTAEMKSSSVILDSVRLNRLKIDNFEIVVTDLSNICEALKEKANMKIDGIIGNDLLEGHKAVINFERSTLTLTS